MRRLLLGMFLMATAMGAAGLALPLYARDLNASYTEIGLMGVAYIVFDGLFSIPAGKAGDRYGRKLLVTIGFLTTSLAISAYYFAGAIFWLILLRFVQGATEAPIWVNAQAAAADVSSTAERGRAMGAFGASWGLGIGVGPLIGGFLYTDVGPTMTFLISGVIALVSTLVIATMPRAKPKHVKRKPNLSKILPPCFAAMIYVGIIAIIYMLFPVYATLGLGMTEFEAGLVIALFSIVRAFLFVPLGGLSDRVGHRSVIIVGIVGSSLVSAAMAFAYGALSIAALLLVLAVAEGATYPAVLSSISKEGEGKDLGYVLGIFNAIAMIGWGLFPGIAGPMADAYGATSPFLVSAAMGFIAVLILWRFLPKY